MRISSSTVLEIGIPIDDRMVTDDIARALNLKAECVAYFDTTVEDFEQVVKQKMYRTDAYLDAVVSMSRTLIDLKRVLKGCVTSSVIELVSDVRSELKHLREQLSTADRDLVFGDFPSMYVDQRKLWFVRWWKNPVTILSIAGNLLVFALKEFPLDALVTSGRLFGGEGHPALVLYLAEYLRGAEWLPLVLIGAVLATAVWQWIVLPRIKPLVPPRLTIRRLESAIAEITATIDARPGPDVAMIVLNPIGAIGRAIMNNVRHQGLGGEKMRVQAAVRTEISYGVTLVRERLHDWRDRAIGDLESITFERFIMTLESVSSQSFSRRRGARVRRRYRNERVRAAVAAAHCAELPPADDDC